MSVVAVPLADDATRRSLAAGLSAPANPRARAMAEFIAGAAGPAAFALIHYGSHAQRSDARAESAWDFFLVVSSYAGAYDSLRQRIGTSYHPRLAALLNRVLAPNVISVSIPGPPRTLAKVAVVSLAHLRRETSARARDHFVAGRLFQSVQVAWARDEGARREMIGLLTDVRERTIEWGAPFLPAVFDAEGYCDRLLHRSYEGEIRPEHRERVATVMAAQRDNLVPAYDALLRGLVRRGTLVSDGPRYRLARPLSAWERMQRRLWFGRSKARATSRWLKYIALYDGWTDYIAEKLSRRTDMVIALTDRERRYPFLFGWPWLWRFLLARSKRQRR